MVECWINFVRYFPSRGCQLDNRSVDTPHPISLPVSTLVKRLVATMNSLNWPIICMFILTGLRLRMVKSRPGSEFKLQKWDFYSRISHKNVRWKISWVCYLFPEENGVWSLTKSVKRYPEPFRTLANNQCVLVGNFRHNNQTQLQLVPGTEHPLRPLNNPKPQFWITPAWNPNTLLQVRSQI